MFSWIHIEDIFRIIQFVELKQHINGVLNCSAPNPITNEYFMQAFRKVKNRSIGLPSPTWMLKMGAFIIGTETELLLKSRWVLPARLGEENFVFQYPTIEEALENILKP